MLSAVSRTTAHLLCVAGVGLVACGSSAEPAPDAADFGEPSTTYPSFTPAIPQVLDLGTHLTDVRVVPIVFAGDPMKPAIADFIARLAASATWHQLVGEYGVGALEAAPIVELPGAAPARTTDDELQALVLGLVDGTHPEVGPVDAATLHRTIYVVHYPRSTLLTAGGGVSCVDFGGYHSFAREPANRVLYATVLDCKRTLPPQDFATLALSHEVLEAATDPTLVDGWTGLTDAGVARAVAGGGGELGDMCAGLPVEPVDVGYTIQRSWSNAEARRFHEPCLPASDAPYIAAVPVEHDTANVLVGGASVPLPATLIRLGDTATVQLDLLSSGPTDDWSVEAFEDLRSSNGAARLELALDRTTGRNGNHLYLHITLHDTPFLGATIYGVRSRLGDQTTVWYGAVAAAH